MRSNASGEEGQNIVGQLLYGSPPLACTFDDRTLAHLQMVITTKLRRGEPFLFSLGPTALESLGRRTLWVHPCVPVQFVFKNRDVHVLNPRWAQAMLSSTFTPQGLTLVPEPVSA